MDTGQIRKVIHWIQDRVNLGKSGGGISILFEEPTEADFLTEGFDQEMIRLTLQSSWWPEMIDDILETPSFVDPSDPPDQVLQYARDVVHEYIGKRIL
jgi:hypothetical protein